MDSISRTQRNKAQFHVTEKGKQYTVYYIPCDNFRPQVNILYWNAIRKIVDLVTGVFSNVVPGVSPENHKTPGTYLVTGVFL